MGEETVAELRVPDVDDAVKRVRALDVAGDDGETADLAPADEAAGNVGTIDDVKGGDVKARAVALIDDDRLLQAARLLRAHDVHVPIRDPRDAADVKLNAFVPKAAVMEDLIESLKADPGRPGTEWIVQCEHSGRRDVSIYYRMDEETQTKLTARIESPIRKDMLVPFLSVLNESELYKSWLPNWTLPRLRVRRSDKLSQTGRCSQVVLVTVDLPWPFSSRECVLDAWGVDDIDASGDICVLVDSMTPGATMRCGAVVPDVDEKDIVRIDFTGGFLFRKLPDGWDAKRDAARAASSWFGTASAGNAKDSTGPSTGPDLGAKGFVRVGPLGRRRRRARGWRRRDTAVRRPDPGLGADVHGPETRVRADVAAELRHPHRDVHDVVHAAEGGGEGERREKRAPSRIHRGQGGSAVRLGAGENRGDAGEDLRDRAGGYGVERVVIH